MNFKSKSIPFEDPLIFWFSGGYDVNVLFSVFTENGPFHINEDKKLIENPHSWNNFSNIVYVEILSGTGITRN